MNKKTLINLAIIAVSILIATGARFVSEIPNFSPMLSIALFAGFVFKEKWMAYLIPITTQVIMDSILGFHESSIAVYLSYALVVFLGSGIKENKLMAQSLSNTLLGAVIFFFITNLSVFLFSPFYDLTLAGFVKCYSLALPFFRNTVAGGLVFSLFIFVPYMMIEKSTSQELSMEKLED